MVKAVEELQLMPEFVAAELASESDMEEQYARTVALIEALELRNMLRSPCDKMQSLTRYTNRIDR